MTHQATAASNIDAVKPDGRGVRWIIQDTHWSRGGLQLALVLLLLAPWVRRRLERPSFLVYLQLPIYMLHQYEEHGHGAFKRELNATNIGKQLTHGKIFVINIGGVWGVDSILLYLAARGKPTVGLAAPYLELVNGTAHIVQALVTRRYNPGLWTSILLFLPFGSYTTATIGRETRATWRDQRRGLLMSLLLHAVVMLIIVSGPSRRVAGEPSTDQFM